MNREIKFRAYDKHTKIMLPVVDVIKFTKSESINIMRDGAYGVGVTIPYQPQIELMQYTGLHDKNGKEIYEGDIVSKETFDDTKPNYRDISYAKVVWIEELASYHLVNKDDKIILYLSDDKYNIEVAGNIYENGDLLKGADNIE